MVWVAIHLWCLIAAPASSHGAGCRRWWLLPCGTTHDGHRNWRSGRRICGRCRRSNFTTISTSSQTDTGSTCGVGGRSARTQGSGKWWKLYSFWPEMPRGPPEGGRRRDIPDCFTLKTFNTERCDSDEDASSARSVPGRGVNTNEQKQCVVSDGCPFPVEEDFCDGNPAGCRELFLCDACHQGYHYECVRRVGSEEECEGMLDGDAVWRCRLCLTQNKHAVSSLLDSLVDDKGDEKLLIRWYRPAGVTEEGQHGTCDGSRGHGKCMASDCQAMRDITIGSRADIGMDYAGLRSDLHKRQRARADRGADRHWRLSQYWASMAAQGGKDGHTHHWSRRDARSLDPGPDVWSELCGISDSYERWRWLDPARRQTPTIRRQSAWLPRHTGHRRRREAHIATINYNEKAQSRGQGSRPLEDQWAEHLVNSLLYKWYAASKVRAEFIVERRHATSRRKKAEARREYKSAERITCPGVGCLATDFMGAVAAELEWWPDGPLEDWTRAMLEGLLGEGATSSQPAILRVCVDKGALDIRSWAERKLRALREQVTECMRRDESCLVLLGDEEREAEGEELPADLFEYGAYGL